MNTQHTSRTSRHLTWVAALLLVTAASGVQAQLVVGSSAADGTVEVRRSGGPDERLLELDPANDQMILGASGVSSSEVDLIIHDPNYPDTSFSSWALWFNSNIGNLYLGSGSAGQSGDDGDLLLRNAFGTETIHLDPGAGKATFGAVGVNGDISVRDNTDAETFAVDGATGDVTNSFGGQGLVKAWCRVSAAGALLDGYRCTDNANYPAKLNLGLFVVDFQALGTDLRTRPTVVSCTHEDSAAIACSQIKATRRPTTDFSAFQITTYDENGAFVDSAFTILVF